MNVRRIAILLTLAVGTAPLVAGCGGAGPSVEAGDEAEVITLRDAAIKRDIRAAFADLETGGGEGDPAPYDVIDVKLPAGVQLTGEALVKHVLPQLTDLNQEVDPEMIPGFEESAVNHFWDDDIADPTSADHPDPADLAAAKVTAEKWRAAKALVESKLTNLKYVQLGYRSFEGGSLETGPVALTLVGQTPSGRLIVISGIVIWT